MFVLSKLLSAVTQPAFWLLLLWLLSLLLPGRLQRLARRLQWTGLAALALLGFLALPDALVRPLENRYPVPSEAQLAQAAGVIVLGGSFERPAIALDHQQVPLGNSAERMTVPAGWMHRHPQLQLVFSGGEGRLLTTGVTEAEMAGQFYTEQGLDMGRVQLENGARTTRENAQRVAALLGARCQQPWLLVTSAWHMPRAMEEFAAGCQDHPVPGGLPDRADHAVDRAFAGPRPAALAGRAARMAGIAGLPRDALKGLPARRLGQGACPGVKAAPRRSVAAARQGPEEPRRALARRHKKAPQSGAGKRRGLVTRAPGAQTCGASGRRRPLRRWSLCTSLVALAKAAATASGPMPRPSARTMRTSRDAEEAQHHLQVAFLVFHGFSGSAGGVHAATRGAMITVLPLAGLRGRWRCSGRCGRAGPGGRSRPSAGWGC
jgi:uncharacterized SAM-binding protein YcdF (DUF218 family)